MGGFGCEEVFTMAWGVVARRDPLFSCGAEKGLALMDGSTAAPRHQ